MLHNLIALQSCYLDSKLTDQGIARCAEAGEELMHHAIFNQVYVSPVRRTIETAVHTLKNHP